MEEIKLGYTKQIMDSVIVEVKKIIVEQDDVVKSCLVGLLSGGHILLEGVPGLAKTLLVRTFAKIMDLDFKRIQFTPDLMPSDVTGTKIFNMKTGDFELKQGPVFTNLLLADEINRTPPRTQAGLLQAMEEQVITIDGQELALPQPYMVLATQNPIEYEGTYPLPEALLDRFIMKILIQYPSLHAEMELLKRIDQGFNSVDLETAGVKKVCSAEEILKCRKEIDAVTVDDDLIQYITEIVSLTRKHSMVEMGCSVRGSIALLQSSKTLAVMQGRDYVLPEDIKDMVLPVLRHRIVIQPEVELEGIQVDQVLTKMLEQVKVPR